MNAALSRRGFIGSSAAIGLGAAMPGSGLFALPAAAQEATPEAEPGPLPGQMNTGTLETRLGPLAYVNGYPTNETSQLLYDAQVYIWGIPAMGFWALRHAQREALGTPDGAMCTYLDVVAGQLTFRRRSPAFYSWRR